MSAVLAAKLLVSPALIGLASLAGKRWGPNIAGLMGGLPLVGGPVVLAVWLLHGSEYATQVSLAAPIGVWATMVYLLVLGFISVRWPWYSAIPFSWLCYLITALLIDASGFSQSLVLGIAIIPGLWIAATRVLPKPKAAPIPAALPQIELFARMAAAALLVWTLTTISEHLGTHLTGVLAGAPVAAVVIPAFTMANSGRDALLITLRGFLTGLMGFAVFFLILGHSMSALGAWAVLPALFGGVAVGLFATHHAKKH
ncbi:hypothetical protein [Stenotrophobium rhamnosiphilum]|uniref:Uncharacterized protein n=1 Tax=Stenotrophobium rhamnosiphilum TaxID=2029166 RepID=A0A2T5MHV0_9GAMM|nr:hypothetical protein [Stenotrophobium rhamnosiphilum]PTU32140.1 hypothetical protein CJD38_05595 [Stenotrophobium rhamnosiphilum]